MPAFTYLSDNEVRQGRTVATDKDCDELLQEFRKATGEDWIILVREWPKRRSLIQRMRGIAAEIFRLYTLYADCHGEWQVINLVTPNGGSVFRYSQQSREDVMNFMLGCLNGIQSAANRVGLRA